MSERGQRIYIADDDKNTCELLSAFLEKDGFRVRTFLDGSSLIDACEESVPDLVILDIMMPGVDGLSVCASLRYSYKELPILILSAKDTPNDRVVGLSLGCDDYMIKPFLPLELVMRVRLLLKRCQALPAEEKSENSLSFGPLTLYLGQHTASLEGEPLPLTLTEFDFLEYLIRSNGSAVRREDLLKTIWNVDWRSGSRVVDDLVKRLRRKLKERNSSLRIKTIWGFGFRLEVDEQI